MTKYILSVLLLSSAVFFSPVEAQKFKNSYSRETPEEKEQRLAREKVEKEKKEEERLARKKANELEISMRKKHYLSLAFANSFNFSHSNGSEGTNNPYNDTLYSMELGRVSGASNEIFAPGIGLEAWLGKKYQWGVNTSWQRLFNAYGSNHNDTVNRELWLTQDTFSLLIQGRILFKSFFMGVGLGASQVFNNFEPKNYKISGGPVLLFGKFLTGWLIGITENVYLEINLQLAYSIPIFNDLLNTRFRINASSRGGSSVSPYYPQQLFFWPAINVGYRF